MTTDELLVLALGSDVLVGGEIPAKILAVTIGEGHIAYKCSWWHEGQHHVDWISSLEVTERTQQRRQAIQFSSRG